MKGKYISTVSNQLLSYFHNSGKDCFNFSEAANALPNSSESALKELLSDMAKRGLLMRIKRGLYCVIPYEKDPTSYLPDWHLLAEHLTLGTEHYIGYYSALQIHDLITQPSLKEQIVVAKQIRPSTQKVKNITFQFIFHNEKHFFGYEKVWIDNFSKVNCSDLEKTFIDCLYVPENAGGIVEIAQAIYNSRNKINYEKLMKYINQFNSQAVIKRLGFLLETLGIENEFLKELCMRRTSSYVLLDTELPRTGRMISRWSIQQNLETETIKSAINT
ncbi:MAG: transcriptional regulator [Bacteroidetes bacterium]|nr:transcriptional regulator [Bacteroidota bacterium]